jgi:Family of unknown function (DUF5706)
MTPNAFTRRVGQWINTLLHTINGLLVGAINALVFAGKSQLHELGSVYSTAIFALLGLTGTCLVASYLFMLKAVWARHHGGDAELSTREKLWFFAHVGAIPLATYKQLLDPFNQADIEATMFAQNHILSRNVATKFDAWNTATSLTIAAVVLFFLLGIVYAAASAR